MPYNFVAKNKIVHSPADFNGMKVGGTGAKMDMVTANGGASVRTIPPEAYMNLDKGVVDGCFITFAQVHDYKIQEVADYFYSQDFGSGLGIMIMNLDAWNSLPPGDQKIMMDTFDEAAPYCTKNSINDVVAGIQMILDAGKKITDPTKDETAAWEKAADLIIDKWSSDAKSLGINQQTIDKVFAAWKSIRQKYVK